MHIRPHEKLIIWQRSYEFCLHVYTITKEFPKHELFSLTNQIRRASYSLPMNIAEGCGRGSEAELARFMQIAMGSASELEYQFILSRDLSYIDSTKYFELNSAVVEVKKMLSRFIKSLRK